LVPGAFSESNRVKAGQAIFPPSQALTRIRRRREVSLKVSYPQQDGRGTFVLKSRGFGLEPADGVKA